MKKKILTLCLAAIMCVSFAACGNTDNTNNNSTSVEKESDNVSTPIRTDYSTVDEYLSDATKGVEKKTSSMVDTIALIAKNDAKNISDNQVEEAISFIRDTYPNYFDNETTMEKMMYYGNLLSYAFDESDPKAILGTDANQVVKYVYRGAEAVDDTGTQENLNQIQKDLSVIQ